MFGYQTSEDFIQSPGVEFRAGLHADSLRKTTRISRATICSLKQDISLNCAYLPYLFCLPFTNNTLYFVRGERSPSYLFAPTMSSTFTTHRQAARSLHLTTARNTALLHPRAHLIVEVPFASWKGCPGYSCRAPCFLPSYSRCNRYATDVVQSPLLRPFAPLVLNPSGPRWDRPVVE